jgi:dTDP-L-rhamnose 4-epimerase
MNHNQSVLITGGAGFIGSKLANRLVQQGSAVTVVDSLHPQVHKGGWPDSLPQEAVTLPFDVTVPSQWDALFKMVQPNLVVHLAAETGTGQSLTEASRHSRVNVVGTTELLDGLSRAGHIPERFVLASSRAVYGEGQWTQRDGTEFYAAARDLHQLKREQWDPVSPDASSGHPIPLAHQANKVEPRPTNVYAATKLAQEHVLSAWASAHGSSLSVLRLQNVYGPGQSLTNPYTGIVSLFAQLGLDHKTIPVYEDGNIVRDFVFVDDVVEALVSACGSEIDSHITVDIGSGEALTLFELAAEIARQTDGPAPIITGQFRHGDVRAAYADISEARTRLGYVPETKAAQGVSKLLDWITTQQ